MKNMNILFSVFLCLYTFSLLGQNALDNSLILRSTFSTSTLTSGENRKFIHQQSSGQSGPRRGATLVAPSPSAACRGADSAST